MTFMPDDCKTCAAGVLCYVPHPINRGAKLNTPDGAPFMLRKFGCETYLRNLRNTPHRLNVRMMGKGVRR